MSKFWQFEVTDAFFMFYLCPCFHRAKQASLWLPLSYYRSQGPKSKTTQEGVIPQLRGIQDTVTALSVALKYPFHLKLSLAPTTQALYEVSEHIIAILALLITLRVWQSAIYAIILHSPSAQSTRILITPTMRTHLPHHPINVTRTVN